MKRQTDLRTIMLFYLLVGVTLSGLAQNHNIWNKFYDHSKRDKTIITNLPPELEKGIHWSPTISEEQKEVIRYILWNMVYVEGGTMKMGENNDVLVSVSSFYINRFEVSQDEWYEIMGENPSNQYRRDHPVDQISWFDAIEFTEKLSQLSGLPFRLPFEAEWEYAARGGIKSMNYMYAGSNNAVEVAWFKERVRNSYVSKAIGNKKPNELDLYDMSGNIYEWCMDWYDKKNPFSGNIDPDFKDDDLHKILRGGSYYTPVKYCKVTSRYGVNPKRWDIDYGLRLVIKLSENQNSKKTRTLK